MDGTDQLVFADGPDSPEPAAGTPWKVLIVDDEQDVHQLTRLVLAGMTFNSRPLELLSAGSAAEARALLAAQDDIALVLLDVVMEEDDAGLRLVRHIREELGNSLVRLVLRTGQPGHAPESSVVREYDINDYREKSQLTAQALVTSVISALRAYEALKEVADLNSRLEQLVAERTAELVESNQRLARALELLREDEAAGKQIQFKLLPPRHSGIDSYRFETLIVPSLFTSGDFLDYFDLDQEHLGFYIADVAGHGVASAFVTILLDRAVKRLVRDYLAGRSRVILEPAAVQAHLNTYLLEEGLDKHLTMFYGIIRKGDNSLTWSPGGHFPPPLLWGEDGVRTLECQGPPVGLFDAPAYSDRTMVLPDTFRLLLFSDGVLEVAPGADQDEKLAGLAASRDIAGGDIRRLAYPEDGAADHHPPDDITFMSIARGGPA